MKRIVFAALYILLPLSLWSQITGIVTTADNRPIAGAYVSWQGTDTGTITNVDGRFEIALSEESDTLNISSVEYAEIRRKVEKGERDIVVVLSQRNNNLEGVTVVSERKSTVNDRLSTMNLQKINSSELRRAACCNLSESFETNPSVDVSYSDAATGAKQIKLLGLSGLYVQLMTEQVPNLKGIATPYGLGYIPGPFMESIQITKGAGSVVNGYEAITGQINVEYKKPQNADKLSANLFLSDAGKVELNADAAIKLNESLHTGILLHASDELLKQDRNNDNFYDMPMIRQFNGINRWYYRNGGLISQLLLHGIYERRMGGQLEGSYNIDIETKRYDAFWKNGYIFDNDRDMSVGLILKGSLQELESTVVANTMVANFHFTQTLFSKHR